MLAEDEGEKPCQFTNSSALFGLVNRRIIKKNWMSRPTRLRQNTVRSTGQRNLNTSVISSIVMIMKRERWYRESKVFKLWRGTRKSESTSFLTTLKR